MDKILKTKKIANKIYLKRRRFKKWKKGKRNEKTKFSFLSFSHFFQSSSFYFKDHKHGLN